MSQYHRTAPAKARAHAARQRVTLPTQCGKCGRMIAEGQAFDMGHARDVAAGGADSALTPEHRSCNRRAGGRLGSAIVNARAKRSPRPEW
jgi:hypothetical protein